MHETATQIRAAVGVVGLITAYFLTGVHNAAAPTLAIDLNSPDLNVRLFHYDTSTPYAMEIGVDYFASGNYLSVDPGATQSFTLFAIATQGAVRFNLSVTYLLDGREHTVLAGDGQGRAALYEVTGLGASYQAADYLSSTSGGRAEIIKTSWARCLATKECRPGSFPVVDGGAR